MNCIELFLKQAKLRPQRTALWLPDGQCLSFEELRALASRAQRVLIERGLKSGDPVLVLDQLGARMYASVIGALALGCPVVLVEPWMSVAKIDHVVRAIQPKVFLTNGFGRLWGIRVPGVRAIPNWVSAASITSQSDGELVVEPVPEDRIGILTFTSGTTGNPKGVVRRQAYLIRQHEVLSKNFGDSELTGPDLCIFANFVLANLASGRGSVVVPSGWKTSHLRKIAALTGELAPESLTCGPAFLLKLMDETQGQALRSLKSIHVGGALTDCWILEKGFARWPEAHWSHVYGSSEAEPVCISDARDAVARSRRADFFQTLSLGHPVGEISAAVEENGAWITGPHVCPEYFANPEENRIHKRRDSEGRVWHFMGDRVSADEFGWWYRGRSGQNPKDFILEQKIYSELQSSKSFTVRRAPNNATDDTTNELSLVGEGLAHRRQDILRKFPEISRVIEAKIIRDSRHRARIDRPSTLRKAGL